MKDLTSAQKKYLKGLSHHLEAHVILGKAGVTPSLIEEIRRSLASHELIKVKFIQSKDAKDEIAADVSREVEASLVAVLGNFMILFKENKRTEDRKIKLP